MPRQSARLRIGSVGSCGRSCTTASRTKNAARSSAKRGHSVEPPRCFASSVASATASNSPRRRQDTHYDRLLIFDPVWLDPAQGDQADLDREDFQRACRSRPGGIDHEQNPGLVRYSAAKENFVLFVGPHNGLGARSAPNGYWF